MIVPGHNIFRATKKVSMRRQYLLALHFLLLFIALPQNTADLSSDKQALLEFVAAVPHGRKLNWTAKSSLCKSWVGVACQKNANGSNVVSLRLPGVGLYGPIPPNTLGRLNSLSILSLHSNRLSGSLPDDLLSLPSLRYIYLQQNNLSGHIPSSISLNLELLDLSFNSFTGSIPSTIQSLTNLTVLSLQNNSLTGSIPDLNLPKLVQLNMSNNQLNGSVPSSLQSFSASSFQGNSMLCGSPLNQCPSSITPSPSPAPSISLPPPPSPPPVSYLPASPTATVPEKPKSNKGLSSGAIIGIAVGVSAVPLLLVLTVVLCYLKKKKSQESSSIANGKVFGVGRSVKPKDDFGSAVQDTEKNELVFLGRISHNFDLEDLLRASAEVLGKGTYGTTYKAILDEGTIVVVKRLKEVVVGKREFEQQMEVIGSVMEHQNVVPLHAYYHSKDEKLLVYDYIPMGSLSALLHGNRDSGTTLDWSSRLTISSGTAKAIAHIHSAGDGNLVHGNIKSSNVLLTHDLYACVSDMGLTPLMGFPTIPMRNAGYRAPEVIETKKCSQKSDVYSFGVLLLEMLTGKSPVKSTGHDDVVDLPRWVQSVVREEWTAEVFYAELTRDPDIEEEMVQMLQIAMACVASVSDVRPNMQQVVSMIDKIRSFGTQSRESSEDNNSRNLITWRKP